MDEFRKCREGHVFDSKLEECPYCNGQNIEDDLEKLADKSHNVIDKIRNTATCYLVGPKI